MTALLEHEDLWKCIEGTETDARKLAKAKAKLILCIDPFNYSHIQSATTAKEVWDKLHTAFDDTGLTRRVSLLRSLATTQLEKCNSVDEYVKEIITTAHKLNGLGFQVSDEWIGTLLLAGLPDEYRPMIMGLESSGMPITADSVKVKILQNVKDMKTAKNSSHQAAFLSYGKKKSMRCYTCNKIGHISSQCRSKPKKEENEDLRKVDKKKSTTSKEKAFIMLLNSSEESTGGPWYVDSCASSHVTNRENWLQNRSRCEGTSITVANNNAIDVKSLGDVAIPVLTGKGVEEITAKNVMYVPGSAANLLSVSEMVNKGLSIIFAPQEAYIQDEDGNKIATMTLDQGIYKLNMPKKRIYFAAKGMSAELWHKRLGHLNYASVIALSKEPTTGVDFRNGEISECVSCIKGKQQRQPFHHSKRRTSCPLELIHSDVCGPMETKSAGGSRYFLTFIDDYSRKVFVYFLEEKSQVKESFIDFKTFMEKHTGYKIKTLRTDNGLEYVNKDLKELLRKSGIKHQLTIRYTPEQNGVAERENRTIIEKAKSMMFGAELPKRYWAEAVATAVYLSNRSPNSSIGHKMPEELWSGEKQNLSHLRVFGCKAFAHVPKELRRKLDPKGREYTFMGYCEDSKGYRLMDLKTNKIMKSRDVTFLEDYQEGNVQNTDFVQFQVSEQTNEKEMNSDDAETIENSEQDTLSDYSDCIAEEPISIIQPAEAPTLRRSSRPQKPIKRDDYHMYLTTSNVSNDPESVGEAMATTDKNMWIRAMKEEYESLVKNDTWTVVEPPQGQKILDTKWVFKRKQDSFGKTQRYRARLVVKGCAQKEGIDYHETYSPVVRYASIRFLCALAAKHNLHMNQMDIAAAYLHGNLKEDIYVRPPKEAKQPANDGQVWKLKKSMYGLKQSGRAWNERLNNELIKLGFKRSQADCCIYFKRNKTELTIIAVYVDDLLVLSNDMQKLSILKKELSKSLETKDEPKQLLGLNISRNRTEGKIWIDQSTHIKRIIQKYGMEDCKPVLTPYDPSNKLSRDMVPQNEKELKEMEGVPFREAVGSILYVSQGSRPDIAYAINTVSRYTQNPGKGHWIAVKRIIRYLKGTLDYKLEFSKDQAEEKSNITGYCDADWANEVDSRRSVTGNVFLFQGGPITWQSKLQNTVALSTTEAEYMSLSASCQEAIWLRALARDLQPSLVSSPTILYNENRGAIDLAKNGGYRPRTKHIDIRHHFIREKTESGDVIIHHLSTTEMIADVLTKGLYAPKFENCITRIGLMNH